jgi:hypothetical protein
MKTLLAVLALSPALALAASDATCEAYVKANKAFAERTKAKIKDSDVAELKKMCKDLPEEGVKKQIPCLEKSKSNEEVAKCM